MSGERTVHARIEGRVQGVGYRAWAEAAAQMLGFPAGSETAATARWNWCCRGRLRVSKRCSDSARTARWTRA